MSEKMPFFARFLEAQELDAVSGGGTAATSKTLDQPEHTMKYPSDGDDHLPEAVAATGTSPIKDDVVVTMKYPSDGDDHLGNEV
ncbi:microviridin/marinostatin family tricyclic proteinase inhibitor [Roseateles sp. DB2]|uniref:microviridin/marinostatin family tricyclic proteinase inhibitor n=1 Tax=Roseateles sp. DB2 TaxID=3453717 RepID=UPI003EEB7BE2